MLLLLTSKVCKSISAVDDGYTGYKYMNCEEVEN